MAKNLTRAREAVQSASALTETRFLEIGQTLGSSIDVLGNLTASFEAALEQLKGEGLGGSLQALSGTAERITVLGRDQSASSALFERLDKMADGIAGRITKMQRTVKSVWPLVTNAKIAVAAIRSTTVDFATFAEDIGRTIEMTARTMESFGRQLQALRVSLQGCHATQQAFEKRQEEATRSIPGRLHATISSIPRHHQRIAGDIFTAKQRNTSISDQVRAAVLALQAGDTVRQRLEHIDEALRLIEGADAVGETVIGGLQAAQLTDSVEQFSRDVGRITASLQSLAREAHTLRSLAGHAYGGSDKDQATFMATLEAEVGRALALFEDFGVTQANAVEAMASVSATAEVLCQHLKTVQSLEADIRIMGLNTTLKCSRAGPQARALGLIAQELRASGGVFAKEAEALMGEVEGLTQITRSVQSKGVESASFIAAERQTMQGALATLQQVGGVLGDTLAVLDRDSSRVVQLLGDTAISLDQHDGIGAAMRDAMAELEGFGAGGALAVGELGDRAEQLLKQIERLYTMADERSVHNRVLGRESCVAPPVVTDAALEDMLF